MDYAIRRMGIAMAVTATLSGCMPGLASGDHLQVTPCPTSRVGEIAVVQRSSTFKGVMRQIIERSGADTIDDGLGHWGSGVPSHSGWACKEVRQETFGGFYGLTVVRALVGSGGKRLDIVFGTDRRDVWVLSGWVAELDSARIDTTGWNAFIRARLDLRLQSTGELTALTCVLDAITLRYFTIETCWQPEPITITTDGTTYTLTGSDSRYHITSDGALAVPPTWTWNHW